VMLGAGLLFSCNGSSTGNAPPGNGGSGGAGSGGATTVTGSGGTAGSAPGNGGGGATGSGGMTVEPGSGGAAGGAAGGSGGSTPGSGGSGSGGNVGGGGNDDAGPGAPDVAGMDLPGPNNNPSEIPDGSGPSADAMAEQKTIQMRLDAITSKIPGTHTLFIVCMDTPPCTARLDAPTLKVMRDLLLAVSADFQGRIDFAVSHHLDGFSGGTYQADVILGTDKKRPVPDDENGLLGP